MSEIQTFEWNNDLYYRFGTGRDVKGKKASN